MKEKGKEAAEVEPSGNGGRLQMQGQKNLKPLVNPILHNLELNSNSCEKKGEIRI